MAKADIEYSSRAVEQLEQIETETAERIISKLDDVAWNPEHYLKGRKMIGLLLTPCWGLPRHH